MFILTILMAVVALTMLNVYRPFPGWAPKSAPVTFGVHNTTYTKDIAFPSVKMDGYTLRGEYTVTDAGIAAGETLGGTFNEVVLYADGIKLMTWKADEADDLVQILGGPDVGTGGYTDSLPTTATEHYAYWHFDIAEDLTKFSNVYLHMDMKAASDEWAGASAFTVKWDVEFDINPKVNHCEVAYRFDSSTSSTQHEIAMPKWLNMQAPYIVLSTGEVAKLYTSDDFDNKDPWNGDSDFKGRAGPQRWARWTNGTYTSGTHTTNYFTGAHSPALFKGKARPNRKLHVEMSAAGTISRGFLVGTVNHSLVPKN